ncbi:MAG: hypothetical protein ACJAQ3_000131 [Planctomycetota bacterium]|jgi:hypothetical protein
MSIPSATLSGRSQRWWLVLLSLALTPLAVVLVVWLIPGVSVGERALVPVSVAPEAELLGGAANLPAGVRSAVEPKGPTVEGRRLSRPLAEFAAAGGGEPVGVIDPVWCTIVGRLELSEGVETQQTHAEIQGADGKRVSAGVQWGKNDGTFVTLVRKPGHYQFRLSALAVGVTPTIELALVLGESVDVGVLRIETCLRMEGRVTLQSGEPLAGYSLLFEAEDDLLGAAVAGAAVGNDQQAIRTDADGHYQFSGLRPGVFKCTMTSSPFEVIEGGTVLAGSVGHRIVVDGSVLVVRCRGENGAAYIKKLVARPATTEAGHRLPRVHADIYAQGSRRPKTRLVDIRSDTPYQILAEGHTGQIYGADWPAGRPAGRYELDLLPHSVETGEILVRAAGDDLSRNVQLIVTSLTQDGAKVRALDVVREAGDGILVHRMKGLAVGTYELSCYLQSGGTLSLGKETHRIEVVSERVTTIDMDVVAGGSLRVELRPPPGVEESRPALVHIRRRPISGEESAWVPLVFWMAKGVAGKRRGHRPRMRQERFPVNGEVAITPGHPPGDYELRVTHPAYEELRVTCRVIAEQTTTCKYQLK